jgi:ABC-type arginine transport system permease subunit
MILACNTGVLSLISAAFFSNLTRNALPVISNTIEKAKDYIGKEKYLVMRLISFNFEGKKGNSP